MIRSKLADLQNLQYDVYKELRSVPYHLYTLSMRLDSVSDKILEIDKILETTKKIDRNSSSNLEAYHKELLEIQQEILDFKEEGIYKELDTMIETLKKTLYLKQVDMSLFDALILKCHYESGYREEIPPYNVRLTANGFKYIEDFDVLNLESKAKKNYLDLLETKSEIFLRDKYINLLLLNYYLNNLSENSYSL